jgi:fructoselysine-6-P-deglycase FrlB-like protein
MGVAGYGPGMRFEETGLWQDTLELPASLAATLDASEGVAEVAALLAAPDVRRIVVTGNGAAYYIAMALWLAALEGRAGGPELVAVPGGLVAGGRFRWRDGDRLLAVSSSGEFRDVVEAIASVPRPFAAITATPGSTLGREADAVALQTVISQRAVTHTQVLAGGVAVALAVWAQVSADAELEAAVRSLPEKAAAAVAVTRVWAPAALAGIEPPPAGVVFGGGPAWAAALEAALLLKEVSRVPAEGVETREGATSASFGLAPGHLALALETTGDPALAEAERVCRDAGAVVLRCPGGALADRRVAAVTVLPSTVAVAAEVALAGGHDVDRPAWTDAYYRTARSQDPGSTT